MLHRPPYSCPPTNPHQHPAAAPGNPCRELQLHGHVNPRRQQLVAQLLSAADQCCRGGSTAGASSIEALVPLTGPGQDSPVPVPVLTYLPLPGRLGSQERNWSKVVTPLAASTNAG